MTTIDQAPPVLVAKREHSRAWRKMKKNKSALVGAVIILFFTALAVTAPILPIIDPLATSWSAIRKAPSAMYWLGTDDLGRDILSRMIWGAQASLMAGVFSVAISVCIGVPFGLVAGYFGGWVDMVISRVTEALLAMPFLIMAIALAAFLGPSLMNAMIAIGLSAMPIFVRLTRGQVLAVKTEDYVEGARAVGLNHLEIMLRYILPNVMAPIIVQATLTIATAIIAEASLSFLGLGQQPPAPSWGSMLNVAKNFLNQAPWMAMWPGAAIFLVVIGFNLLGDGLRDALDPREA
ncbi:peptide/nickel transport system permease protein [Neorhizobium sp. R1-B]|jgi:peptide/nickel transport system permease protein|uniref:ABC transporter permease n=1 Tax=unclassified Neorhizobium TaxID=2629175 RepID=UPI000DD94238|nr:MULTISPECIES: ABC transporter permease [unclassified Neorhizobium]TCV62258.1 peptide/nickel transport system permease protein [Neorhizobium sp. S3-V5DH]TDX71168.1 peptide/nickel transport system permease protein [Neorhizobium sp. R1-B]